MRKITLLTCCLSLFGAVASAQSLYDDFESNSATTFGTGSKFNYIFGSDGAIVLNATNPSATGNSSSTVAKWSRDGSQYPAVQFALFQTMTDVAPYATNAGTPPKITMKTYTTAPVGTPVMITISSRTETRYPEGVYTTFITSTTVQNAWETLTFDWNPGAVNGSADFGSAAATACGRFVIQLNNGFYTPYDLYFDDIQGPGLNAAPTGAVILYDDFQSNTDATTFATSSKFSMIANSDGAIDVDAANPSQSGINTSTKVALWNRPAGTQFPNVSFALKSKIDNAYAYSSNMSGTPKITLKVYTDAPVGTEILVRFDSSNTNGAYPSYVFTTFRAITSVQNAWETITMDWQPNGTAGSPFGTTATNDVSRVAVIIDNGGTTAYSMYIDDFTGPGLNVATGITNAASAVASTKLYPNPSNDMVTVQMELHASSQVKVTLSDMMGREVMTIAEGSMVAMDKSFSTANLNKGVYTVNYFVNGSAAKSEMLMVK